MSKRKILDIVLSRKRVKKTEINLPIELILIIFDVSSFKVKMKFGMVSRILYKRYQDYVKGLSKKCVFYTGRRPTFYEFQCIVGKKKKYVRFSIDQKIIRRELKLKNGILYCRIPTDGYSKIYMIDQEEKDYIGKSCCDGCKGFTYCDSRKFRWLDPCYLRNCSIKEEEYEEVFDGQLVSVTSYEEHDHNLCDKCKNV
jgi:hypothetical protein